MELVNLTVESFDKWREDLFILFREAVVVNFPANQPSESYYYESINKLALYIAENKAMVFLAVEGENLLGMAWCHTIQRFNEKRLHIASIAVMPKNRKMGVGKFLLQEVENYAIKNHYIGVDLLVTADNVDAVNFYHNSGFEIERLLMKRILDDENRKNS